MYRYMSTIHNAPSGQDELRPFFRSGEDRGRIYRIVRAGSASRKVPRMDLLSTVELVAALESPNGWQRDTAQRLLVTAKEQSAVTGLERLVMTSQQPLARLHALCTLDGLNALSPKIVETCLKDVHPGVRRQAVRLSVTASVAPHLLASLVDDPDAKVRLQLACTLGDCIDEIAGAALGKLLVNDADPFLRAAAMSSLNAGNTGRVVDEVVAKIDEPAGSRAMDDRLIDDLFGQVAAIGDDPVIVKTLTLSSDAKSNSLRPWQMTALASELDTLAARGWCWRTICLVSSRLSWVEPLRLVVSRLQILPAKKLTEQPLCTCFSGSRSGTSTTQFCCSHCWCPKLQRSCSRPS